MSGATRPDDELVSSARFYDAYAEDYSSYLGKHADYIEAVEADVVAAAAARRDVSILDVGTGNGERFARLTAKIEPARAVAVDESQEMATAAARLCPDAEVFAASLTDSTLAESVGGRFDIVTCLSNVLGHVPTEEIVPALRQVKTVLKPDGVLIFDVNNRYNMAHYGRLPVWRNKIKDLFSARGGDFVASYTLDGEVLRTTVHLFTRSEVTELLRRAGFAVHQLDFRNYTTGERSGEHGGSIVVRAVAR